MKVGKKVPTAPAGLVPVKVRWSVSRGHIQAHTKEEMVVRALHKALGSLIPKRGETGDGFQYALMGPHLLVESCSTTGPSGGATYVARGRALIGKTHMKSGTYSEDVHAFSLMFKETVDAQKLPDLEVSAGDISALPRGSRLF